MSRFYKDKHFDFKKVDNLYDIFSEIVRVYSEIYSDVQAKRLGLRYINEIKLSEKSPLDWSDYINPILLGLFSYNVEGASTTKIFPVLIQARYIDTSLSIFCPEV